MTVSIFGQSQRHRAVRLDADPRIVWTACDIRFHPDPSAYQRAMRVQAVQPPSGRCGECFA